MPFAIWCNHCPKPTIIGQGVRFNAEKKKIGAYYSTPIYSFRMKHTACGGWIEIQTDPKNTAYVVTEGAKKRDTGEDKVKEGDFVIQTPEEREQMRNDAFAALEGKVEDRRRFVSDSHRIEELKRASDKDWEDPYEKSRKLRRTFRVDRKLREKQALADEDLRDRLSLGIDLLEESEGDRRRAGLIDFGVSEADTSSITKATARPLFASDNSQSDIQVAPKGSSKKKRKVAKEVEIRDKLYKELSSNTRAAIDPFLNSERDWGPSPTDRFVISGLKRKRTEGSPSTQDRSSTTEEELAGFKTPAEDESTVANSGPSAIALVDYESDD
ncbi:hypothetical protein L228DRAFT_164655 [Xylona heveae TC161]|uniref:DUF572-domain-containing protein n=1 Tax=Xylona heveae (strain CBS 132557 / TC161) TaxID=1328760 RepID=A0A165FI82_XYLHT|nr:hypothetical protein L228DRAFT_164655 [Xylona heveae TC161]KZF21007.1 hypothetical protein L228DRAFT_164655 [Xylona heveae TC161]